MLRNYLKIAFKVMLRRKFYTFISLFAICFTLVVLNVATALLDFTFGPMAPESNGDRTIGIFGARLVGERYSQTGLPGYGLLDRYARDLPGVEQMSICTFPTTVYTYKDGERIPLYYKRADGQFWQILDFQFLEGGPFTVDDERNGNLVAVINDATRRRLFGDAQAVGKTVEVDGRNFQIVGVVANVPFLRVIPFADVWVPMSSAKSDAYKKAYVGDCMAVMLANSPSDFSRIRDEYHARLQTAEMPPGEKFREIQSNPATLLEFGAAMFMNGGGAGRGDASAFLAAIGFVMFLFMLLPTVNLTNINVSRILERASEIGVRKAFGASSWTLVGQFVVENVAITLIGGVLAFAVSQAVLSAVTASGLIPYADLRVNVRVFSYGLAIAAFFGVVSGVYPAWKMSRLNPVAALKGGVR